MVFGPIKVERDEKIFSLSLTYPTPILSYPVLSCPLLSYPILSYPINLSILFSLTRAIEVQEAFVCPISGDRTSQVLFYNVLRTLLSPILSYPVLSYPVLSCPMLS